MRLIPVPFSAMSRFLPPFFLDYVVGKGKAAELLPGEPHSAGAVAAKAKSRIRPLNKDVLQRMDEYLRSLHPPAAVQESMKKLSVGAACVVTGQQPGLFGGPAYNLYKALTAIKIAHLVERQANLPCVPVFWNHSDDHSLQEFSTIGLRRNGDLVEIAMAVPEDPVPAYLFDSRWNYAGLLERATPLLPAALSEILRACYQDVPGLSFSRLLLKTLGSFGLVVVEPRILEGETTRQLYVRVLKDHGAVREALEAGMRRATGSGYEPALKGSGGTGIFRVRDGLRQKIESVDGGFRADGERMKLLGAMTEPRLSPQVFLRPVLQDAIFPTAAYVGGPHELCYLAELSEVYSKLQVPVPLFVPRFSGTVIDAGVERAFNRLGLGHEKAFLKRDELTAEILRSVRGNALSKIESLQGGILEAVDGMKPDLGAIDKGLEGAVDKTVANLESIFGGLKGRIVKAVEAREQIEGSRLTKVFEAVRPAGDLQERREGFISLLAQAGEDFPARLLEEMDPFSFAHQFVVLDKWDVGGTEGP